MRGHRKRGRDEQQEEEDVVEEEQARGGASSSSAFAGETSADTINETLPTVPEDVGMHMVAGDLASLNLIDVDGPPCFDQYCGEQLPDEDVQKAMAKELDSGAAFEAVRMIDEKEYPKLARIHCRWVIHQRPTGVKARIVAQQLNLGHPMEGAYASTPAAFAQNMVFVFAETSNPKLDMLILPGDVSTAFLHAALPEERCVVLIPPSPQRIASKAWLPLRGSMDSV